MKYFSYISNEYALKNRLEKEVFDMLSSRNRQVIDESEVETFKEKILQDIEALNKQFPKCKPLGPYWYQSMMVRGVQDIRLILGGINNPICNFFLYHSKN